MDGMNDIGAASILIAVIIGTVLVTKREKQTNVWPEWTSGWNSLMIVLIAFYIIFWIAAR